MASDVSSFIRSWICVVLMVCGCARPGTDVTLEDGDFALLEFALFDCTANDQHVGLDKFLRGLYGTRPSIDLDRGIARLRIPYPAPIDPAGIARGFERANAGLGWMMLTVKCTLSPGRLTLIRTRQEIGAPMVDATDSVPRWRRIVIPMRDSEDYFKVRFVEEFDGPDVRR